MPRGSKAVGALENNEENKFFEKRNLPAKIGKKSAYIRLRYGKYVTNRCSTHWAEACRKSATAVK